jgi:large subunit ribosomal protein L31
MKTEIHPEYKEVEIRCACGAVLKSKSTRGEIRLDICAYCHPFFTGTQKIIDTEGRVERFKKKYAKK